jgi:hypothetical protein
MSLKAFHLLFISLSIVLSVAFGMWAITTYRADGAMFSLVAAVAGFAGAAGLGVYEAAFVRKCRRIGV